MLAQVAWSPRLNDAPRPTKTKHAANFLSRSCEYGRFTRILPGMGSSVTDPALRDLLRRGQLRVTSVRLAILRALGASKVAMDAADVAAAIKAAGEDADRVTVYRTLNSLVDSGIAHRVDPGDRVFRFSLTDHGRCSGERHEHEHPHMVCDHCGAVECIDDAEVIIRSREGAAPDTPRRKLNVTQQDIMLHGTCTQCSDETDRTPRSRPKP